MALDIVKTVNFGSSKGSLTTVGYRLCSVDGSLSGSRTTSGVGEVLTGVGIYSASIHFSTNFNGSILWDTGGSSPTYATEDYNPAIDLMSASIDFTRHISSGRWVMVRSRRCGAHPEVE